MSKIIICADLHLHNARQFSNRVDWLEIGISVFKQAISYSLENNDLPIVVLGDIVHLKDRVSNSILNKLYDVITDYADRIPFYLLVGTHDAVVASDSSLRVLGKFDNINVLDGTTELSIGNIICYFIPYRKTTEEFIENLNKLSYSAELVKKQVKDKRLLFIHQEVNGSVYDNNYEIKNSITKSMFTNFDHVFAGHLHKPQDVGKKITYVGSMHQTKFDECGNENSFIVYDSETNTYERIITTAPEFVVDEFDNDLTKYNNKFVELYVDSDVNRNEIRKNLYDNGCLGVVFKEKQINKTVKKIEMKPNDSFSDIFEKYVNQSEYKHKDKLIELGKQFLENVK